MSAGQQYSRDQLLEEDDGLNHEEGGVDMPLYDIQTQDKLEFKKFLRLQREGLVNIKDIFQKM